MSKKFIIVCITKMAAIPKLVPSWLLQLCYSLVSSQDATASSFALYAAMNNHLIQSHTPPREAAVHGIPVRVCVCSRGLSTI